MHALPITYSECGEIYGRTADAGLTSILFVSTDPGEGTSTVAYAIAQRAAASGKRVLYMDFNTRSSYPRDVLRVQAGSWTLGRDIPDEAMTVVTTDGLTLLPAPLERSFGLEDRDAETAAKAIRDLLDEFDLVIGDAPCLTRPNGHAIAPAALSAAFEGTVLTVATATTAKESIEQALNAIRSAGGRLCGCVLVDRVYPALSDELNRQFQKLGRLGGALRWLTRPIVVRIQAIEGQF